MNCPHCVAPLSERGSFCKACGRQVRCMSCRALLETDAIACVECGVTIGEAGATLSETKPDAAAVPPGRNTLSFQEDKNNRRFEASLTDAAMQSLGGVFGDLFAQRGMVRLPPQIAGVPGRHAPVVNSETLALPPTVETADVMDVPTVMPPVAAIPYPDKEKIAAFFSSNGEKLELIDNRLKSSSGADYLRQLTYFFLYAHELHGRMSVPERDLNIMLTAAKMMDASGNTRRWLRSRVGIGDEGDGNVKLNNVGRDAAKKTLRDALDTNIVVAWNPDSAAGKPKTPKSSKGKGKAKS